MVYIVLKYEEHLYSFNRGNRSDFQLINITKYIAFASLTQVYDKYLCICFGANKSVNNTLIKPNTVF